MRITGIVQTSNERFKVTLEDGTELRTTLGVVTDLRLYTDKELNLEELLEFRLRSARSLTLERAVEMISYRPYSCKELQDKLINKGIDPEIAAWCPEKLKDMGLMDDARYAASLVRHYASRGYGAGRIRAEFSHRGIARELWEEALQQLEETEPAIDRLLHSRLKDPSDRDQVRKATASLARRGYSWDEIRSALKRMEAELEEAAYEETGYEEN